MTKLKPYKGDELKEISFPIGGIGTGCVGISGRGLLRDFEIYNRPNKGSWAPKTYPLIRIAFPNQNKEPIQRVLAHPPLAPYTPIDGGKFHAYAEGFPHMDECEFRGEYPFAFLTFKSEKIGQEIRLEAWNPFIPCDPESSGIPIAIFTYAVKNPTQQPVEVSILWSLLNIASYSVEEWKNLIFYSEPIPSGNFTNTVIESDGMKGIFFERKEIGMNYPNYNNVFLGSPDVDSVSIGPYWNQRPWFVSQYDLWNDFKRTGEAKDYAVKPQNRTEAGVVCIKKRIEPNSEQLFTFYFSWYSPNAAKYWAKGNFMNGIDSTHTWKNYYASKYTDAFDVARKTHQRIHELRDFTKKFHNALFESSFPEYVLDAISANMSILKTPTCLRLQDGTFYSWEGCNRGSGCCEGSCNHVWNYEQTLPFLFPSLRRSMHEAHYRFDYIFPDIGALRFRTNIPLGDTSHAGMAAADAQFGNILHFYRDWKLYGNLEWLDAWWPAIKKALEFAWEEWDEEKKGVLQGPQHNTYDIEFYGVHPMTSTHYIAALLACAEMAETMASKGTKLNKQELQRDAKIYREIASKGAKFLDKMLFNGEYYEQKLEESQTNPYQTGPGCLIDQLLGYQLADLADLKELNTVANRENIKTGLKAIYKYNRKENMKEHENGARIYAINEESAVVECTWPKGGRLEIPMPYSDEVFNGSEYQFAAHLMFNGFAEEALNVVKAVRARYNGKNRNPWDEFECGHNYIRSMAAFGMLIACSGFTFNMFEHTIGFAPKIYENKQTKAFKTFWSVNDAWGVYEQNEKGFCLKVLWGKLTLKQLTIKDHPNTKIGIKITDRREITLNSNESGVIIFIDLNEILDNCELIGTIK